MRRGAFVVVFALSYLETRSARATYSICAVDTDTRDVGGAGTSCVGTFSVSNIYGSAEGHGVVHAQAQYNPDAKDRAIALLKADTAPDAILAELLSPAFDVDFAKRQYAILDTTGRTARYTGAEASPYASDRGGAHGSLVYTVQGNIVTGAGVLDRAAAAFEGGGCDLADRLMRALEAGAEMGEGDMRCTMNGIPSDGAFIEVDRPGEARGSFLRLKVDNTAPNNPLVLLRADFDRWRSTHPCPVIELDAGPADATEGTDAGEEGAADARTAADAAPRIDRSDEGCTCSATHEESDFPFLLFLLVLLARRHEQRHKR